MAIGETSVFSIEHPDGVKTELISTIGFGEPFSQNMALVTTFPVTAIALNTRTQSEVLDWIATRLEEIAEGIRKGPTRVKGLPNEATKVRNLAR